MDSAVKRERTQVELCLVLLLKDAMNMGRMVGTKRTHGRDKNRGIIEVCLSWGKTLQDRGEEMSIYHMSLPDGLVSKKKINE